MTHINQSQVKQFLSCQQRWDYQYHQRLQPKRRERPLYLGSWGHRALETFYRDGDWRPGFEEYKADYDKLFEEERRSLDKGSEPLPSQLVRILNGYFFRYANDGWKVLAVERDWRVSVVTKKDTIQLGGKLDLLIEDRDENIWVVDNKFTSDIPDKDAFHAMDPQLILYPWGVANDPDWQDVLQGREIAGVIYNYVLSTPPTVPHLNAAPRNKPDMPNRDREISKAPIKTDYLTMLDFLVSNDKDPAEYSEALANLRESDEFLRRYRLPRSEAVTERMLFEFLRTAYTIRHHNDVVRNVTRDCGWCPYRKICRAELFGLDTTFMREADYVVKPEDEEDENGGNARGG